MAQKSKCFYIYTAPDPLRRVRRGECVPLVAVGLACPLCHRSWTVKITPAGRETTCERCKIAAYSVKVWYTDKSARPAVKTNKKGLRVAV